MQSEQNNTEEKTATKPQKVAEEQQTAENETQTASDSPESLSDLEKNWQEIAESLKDDGPRINSVMQNAQPKQIDDNTIQIDITAEIQKDLFAKFDEKIIRVLQRRMKNNELKFKFNLVESEVESKRPLTDVEKYQELMKRNPVLEKLREKFNLDLKK